MPQPPSLPPVRPGLWRTCDIRAAFRALLAAGETVPVPAGQTARALVGESTLELLGVSFLADEETLFGRLDPGFVARERAWYESRSLNLNDFPGGAPALWWASADPDGCVNSNYGWCVFSPDNGGAQPAFSSEPAARGAVAPRADVEDADPPLSQYQQVLLELRSNPHSRRAVMIYTRPSMWLDHRRSGRSDFLCTNTVHYLLRQGALHAVVNMRSNDAVLGYRNDRAWQRHVQERLAADLGVAVGDLIWQVGSLHVYQRHYRLVDPPSP